MIEAVAAGEVWENPIIPALVVAIPTAYFGWKASRHAEKEDKVAAQAAVGAADDNAIQRVIDGLDRMVANLQADNAAVRDRATELTGRLRECNTAYAELQRRLNPRP